MSIAYASVCDGIGAAHAAWQPLGMRCAWTSEIDPFPAAVVDHHWNLPNLGDMTKINAKDAINEHGRINLLVGGTPCQSFSVAGLRKGLDDPRGNLALVFLRLVDELRPEWMVWENVPGVLSSDEGRDFGSIVGAMGELGYGWAYRVLDAQYVRVESHPYAVPQRRKRVFVVGHLGDWRRAAAVLFEREGMSGDSPPSRWAGKAVAADVAPCLVSSGRGVGRAGDTRGQDPVVAQPFPVANYMTRRMHKGINTTVDEGQTPVVAFTNNGGNTGLGLSEEHSPPMTAINSGHPMIAFDTTQITNPLNRSNPKPGAPCHSLAAGAHPPSIADDMAVRRLTPRECERLQGFPDDYTAIQYRGKPASDTARYKALGNSMAVNVMSWIGQRIKLANKIGDKT